MRVREGGRRVLRTEIAKEAGVFSLSDVLERLAPSDWDFKFHFRVCKDEGRSCQGTCSESQSSETTLKYPHGSQLLQCVKCGFSVCCICPHQHSFDHLGGFGRDDAEISEKVIEIHKACCEVIFERQSG